VCVCANTMEDLEWGFKQHWPGKRGVFFFLEGEKLLVCV